MFEPIAAYYLSEFNRRGEQALKDICNLKVPSEIILWEYKKLEPIEKMPEKDKKELKIYVHELFPKKTVQEKLNAAKIIYTIGSLLN